MAELPGLPAPGAALAKAACGCASPARRTCGDASAQPDQVEPGSSSGAAAASPTCAASGPAQDGASAEAALPEAHVALTVLAPVTGGARGAEQPLPECRICLSSDSQADMVAPCSCSGTVSHAHLGCLKAWVHERNSLDCELCGKQYRDGVRQQLEGCLDPTRRGRGRGRARPDADGDDSESQLDDEGEQEQPPPGHASWTRFWIHLGVLAVLLVAVLYLALWVNISTNNFWLLFLWRAITVVLPLFLAIRCCAALYAWRQAYIATREQQQRAARRQESRQRRLSSSELRQVSVSSERRQAQAQAPQALALAEPPAGGEAAPSRPQQQQQQQQQQQPPQPQSGGWSGGWSSWRFGHHVR